MMQIDFAQRHVAVTGAFGALGSATVATLLEAGAVVHALDHAAAPREMTPWREHPNVRLHGGLDLADEATVETTFGSFSSLYASVHVAGGFAMAPITETTLAELNRMLTMNLTTAFLCSREAVRAMRRGGTGGRIVNVAARPALVPSGGMVAYSVSKAAVASLTQSLGEELRHEGIWVNAVVPGTMDTPTNRAAMPGADFSTWATTAGVAATIAFLASPQNTTTRGGLVPVFGAG